MQVHDPLGSSARMARRCVLRGAAVAGAIAGVAALLHGAPVSAAVFPVSDASELVAAIDAADATPAVDVIELRADVTLTAVVDTTRGPTGTPIVDTPIVIVGNGFAIARDAAAPPLRLFAVEGGGFFGDGALTLDGVVLRGGDVSSVGTGCFVDLDACGGAILNLLGEVTIRNGTVFEDNAAYGGGALFNSGNASIEDAVFTTNRATSGGVLYNTGGLIDDLATILVRTSRFEGNEAVLGGGAIHNEAELDVVDSVFLQNRVTSVASFGNGGGAAYNTSFRGAARFAACTFTGNEAPRGGALSNYNASGLTVVSCAVSDNGNGAAVLGSGGGIWSDNNTDLTVRSSRIVDNATGSFGDGGGIYSGQNNALVLESSTVAHNVAGRDGGGIWMSSINTTVASTIVDSQVDFNQASGDGGGIYKSGSSPLTIVASSISDNENTGFNGGGLAIDCIGCTSPPSDGVTIVASTIARNVMTTGDGGGISNENQGVLTISDSTISDNAVTGVGGVSGLGGGIYSNSTNSRVTVVNSTLSGNSAQSNGGGTYNSNASVMTLEHVTLTGNTAGLQGGGAFAVATTNVRGAVIAGNVASHPVNPQQHDCGGLTGSFVDQGSNFVSSTSAGVCPAGFTVSGSTNLGALADNGGPTATHALLAGSVAIDAAGSCGLATDQRGVPRTLPCDAGAFEGDVVLPTVRFVTDDSAVDEDPGGVHEVSVLLDNRAGTVAKASALVHVTVVGTAADGDDYALATLPPLDFSGTSWPAPGTGTVLPIALDVVRDFVLEGDETVRLELRDAGIVGAADLGTRAVHTVTIRDAVSDLAVEKTVEIGDDAGAPGVADPGDEIVWRVTVTNLGPTSAEDVTLEDVLDVTIVDPGSLSTSATLGTFDPVTREWSADGAGAGTGFDLPASTSATLTVRARVRSDAPGGTLANTASLRAAFPPRAADPDPANDIATASIAVFACPSTPTAGCTSGFAKGMLVVNEKQAGKESLVAQLRKGPAIALGDFGDPLAPGGSGYLFCLYDDQAALVAALEVDRAGALCPTRPCWKPFGGKSPKGFRYVDNKDGVASGVRLVHLGAGAAGKSTLQLRAKNVAQKGQTALPTGIATALETSADGATLQVLSSDAACFSASFAKVTKRAPALFRAVVP